MDSYVEKLLDNLLEINRDVDYEFKTLYGLTFVFKKQTLIFNDEISSAELKPVAIIYEENDQYYLAPIDEVGEIEEIIIKFVENKQKNI